MPSTCQYYSLDELDELEDEAAKAEPQHQMAALEIVARIFHDAELPYALMGGMNFFLRGSGRTTDDIDVLVGGNQSLEATLNLLNKDPRITRPKDKMIWLSGVARVFLLLDGQQVQVDLKWQRAEGRRMPLDLTASTEPLQVTGSGVVIHFLAIGPLVKTKFQAYCNRDEERDYLDLLFVCNHPEYRHQVRAVANQINESERAEFLAEVMERNTGFKDIVRAVRWALRLDDDSGASEREEGSFGRF